MHGINRSEHFFRGIKNEHFFRVITKTISSLFRGFFSERNFDVNPNQITKDHPARNPYIGKKDTVYCRFEYNCKGGSCGAGFSNPDHQHLIEPRGILKQRQGISILHRSVSFNPETFSENILGI
jgi:hypothetical protein